jgi:hypothetical protein
MRQFYALTALLLFVGSSLYAQPIQPFNPPACNGSNCTTLSGGVAWDACSAGSTTFVSSMPNNPSLFSGSSLSTGAVYRYANVGTISGVTVNLTVTIDAISNAILQSIDDNTGSATDEAGNSVIANFSPRISPDVTLNASRRGYVQFTFRFFNASVGNGYTSVVNLNNPVFVHYDNDGNGNSNGWFRETGVAARLSPTNPTVVAAAISTELIGYSYNDINAVNATNTNWAGFAGSVCERTNISKCSQVAAAIRYSTSVNSITYRFGYDFKFNGSSGGQPVRQYAGRLTCFGTSQSTLPLTITQLNVNHKEGQAQLLWSTVNEDNFSHFEVERSVNGKDFQSVGSVEAKGMGSITTNYHFADDIRLVSGNNVIYRLKMVDNDDTYAYSATVSLRRSSLGTSLNLSPNPANTNLVIRFKASASGQAQISISDLSGRTLIQRNAIFGAGDNNISIPEVSRLNEGVYTIRVINGAEILNDRLVIKK